MSERKKRYLQWNIREKKKRMLLLRGKLEFNLISREEVNYS